MTNPNTSKKVAIVTGASAGLGKDFAHQMATRYPLDEIWLVARRAELLQNVALTIKNCKAVVLELDLRKPNCYEALTQKLSTENANLLLLVNNAGLGKLGSVESLTLEEQLEMVDVNIRALTALTRALLPYISSGGGIIQVASCAAFTPSPYFAVYAATKSYVVSFSHALRTELSQKNIHVLAVCPGPVATEFQSIAEKTPNTKSRAFMAASPDVVAKALSDFDRKKSVSIYGLPMRIFSILIAFVPKSLALPLIAKRNQS